MAVKTQYKTEQLAAPAQDIQKKLRARKDISLACIRKLRTFVNSYAKGVDEQRTAIAQRALDAQTNHRRITDAVAGLWATQGAHEAAKLFYANMLGILTHRPELTLGQVYRYTWISVTERALIIAKDDGWSGYGNDNKRQYRDGYLKAMDEIKWLAYMPILIPDDKEDE